ncbi:Uncharacterised protein [Vibrio cholerae]|uniref:Uncharacterized protein n=1 Tax=Vibrio cholerae TaxID=666 RepID=A0A655UNY9_VIBCL|nr:Uncharacterised protein [Vibrio cholerae]CSB36639.1 Uncharacterised protein [Vibrio cholerae]CSB38257.1 Uncharacterised protein [Vibrio cholerae]CSB48494.1 Uncharacterised protein [Vibrio cholerae]CSB53829.1 Uncharacterised protein [Vibrio cholerae]
MLYHTLQRLAAVGGLRQKGINQGKAGNVINLIQQVIASRHRKYREMQ